MTQSLLRFLPNTLTLLAVVFGLYAIKLGYDGRFSTAVTLILIAAILDGLDGRIARALGSASPIGAELDSLADAINFGIAPALVLYFRGLADLGALAWGAVLIYAICAVYRLARFNVGTKSDQLPNQKGASDFKGIPSPAAAFLVMLPLYISFATGNPEFVPPWVSAGFLVLIGFGMIARFRVPAFKSVKIGRNGKRAFIITLTLFCIGLYFAPWAMLVAAGLIYLTALIWWSIGGAKHET